MTRSLLLKGLAGVAALGGTAVGGVVAFNKGLFGGGKAPEEPKSKDVSNFTQKELIDKVGLDCKLGESETELTDNTSKDCTVKDNGSINIKKREQEEEGVTFTGNGSKLKVSKSEESGADGTDKYTKKLKFVVDSGDLTLTKKEGGSTPSTITKLEQFETYEIFLKSDGKFYLRRKTDAKEEKIKALGLPSGCTLPDSATSECSLTTEGEIKAVKFDGQNDGVTVSTGTVTLKISKMSDSDTDFGESKYRFTFTFPGDVTINSKQLKGNTPYDFKIKKGSGNTLTLERAWSEDKEFAKKAGLDCNDNTQCSISSGSKLNIKAGTKIKEGISSINTGTGKIKMEKDQPGYNQGLKFTITGGDVTISDGTASGTGGDITKLEELETYEITEEGGKYYLTRKTSKDDGIRSSLSLPKDCELPATGSSDCTLSADDFKNINFEGKDTTASGSGTLTVSKGANTTDFPLGYRFTLQSQQDITIKSSTNIVKANIPTDFKIKKQEGKVSLEKAWSEFSFAEKVGLNCTTQSGDTCCTKSGSTDINVKKGTETKTGITSFGTSDSGKIKVEKDQAGYNQGLKFTISGGSVTLSGGNGGSFNTLDEYETYEIKEEGGKYYLTRKTEASKTIGDLLGLPEKCKVSSGSCSLNTQELKNIKFEGKDSGNPSTGNATLTIAKATDTTDFPFGYKFTFKSTSGDITIKATDNIVKKGISTDFKIKKPASTGSLSLEKAWTLDSLGKKVGLSCTNGTECTIEGNGNKLKVKQISENHNDIKQKSLTKKANGGSGNSGKIKVTKDVEGYNQGFKFEISEGFIELDGTTGTDEGEKITRLGEYETYEIKEIGNEGWFLSIKDKADSFIFKKLGLDNISSCTSIKLPRGTKESDCRFEKLDDLKKVKFGNAGSHNWSGELSDSNTVQLMIGQDSSLPVGFKFTFEKGEDVCLPDGNGGKVNLKDASNDVVYKINKNGTDGSWCLEKKDGSSSSSC